MITHIVNSSSPIGTFPSTFRWHHCPGNPLSIWLQWETMTSLPSPLPVLTGVPQRLVLGPIICQHGFSYQCYADDTSCTCFSPGWPLNLKLSLRHIRSTTTSNLTLLKLSCWFSQPTNSFITALTLKLRPSLLLPWRLFEIWSHDWWSTAFFWSCSLSLPIVPLHSTSERSYHSWPNMPLSHWNKPWWDCD